MEIHLQLLSGLREKLPPETEGRAVLNLDKGATLADLLGELGIKHKVIISVNGVQEADTSRLLEDGERVRISPPGS